MEKDSDAFTTLSSEQMKRISTELEPNAEQIAQYVADDFPVRRFVDVLSTFFRIEYPYKKLLEAFILYNPGVKPDSLRKKLSNWLEGKNEPANREDLLQLCFALALSESEANSFLAQCGDGRLHLRNPRELAFAFCLRTKRSYLEALDLIARLPAIPPTKDANCYTRQICDAFGQVTSEEEFFTFLQREQSRLGALHNTAYRYFNKYYKLLAQPQSIVEVEERKSSVEEIVAVYIRMNVPTGKRTKQLNALQNAVRAFWPNTTSIKNMLARREDVTRKSLLLLYALTNGGIETIPLQNDPWAQWDELESEEERFENQVQALNLVLDECGMGGLDPRNPFDYLILYSLKAEEEGMAERLRELLNMVFPPRSENG